MTQPPPSFEVNAFDAYRQAESVPSDTQAIYIQEGGKTKGGLFDTPGKHPKILRLQEIMIVSALLCFVHALIATFAGDAVKPLPGLPSVGPAYGIVLLVVSLAIYALVYFTIQGGKRIGLTVGLVFAIIGAFVAILALVGSTIETKQYGFLTLYVPWFVVNVLWIRAAFDPEVKANLV